MVKQVFLLLFFSFQVMTGVSGGSISGKVTHAVTGAGIEKVKVTISGAEGIFETLTDSRGTYLATHLPMGTYLVIAQAEGFLPNFQTRVQLSQAIPIQIDLVLTPISGSGVIYGRITDRKTGLGIKGAQVTVSGLQGIIEVITDEKGNYSVSDLPAGVYVVLAKADHFFSDLIGKIVVTDEAKTLVNVALMPFPEL